MLEKTPRPGQENHDSGDLPSQLPTEEELEQIFKLTDQFSQRQAEAMVLGQARAKVYRKSLGESEAETEAYAEVEGQPLNRPINSANSSRKREITIDRRRLGPRGKIIADKGPVEVEEDIARNQGRVTEEEKLIGLEQSMPIVQRLQESEGQKLKAKAEAPIEGVMQDD